MSLRGTGLVAIVHEAEPIQFNTAISTEYAKICISKLNKIWCSLFTEKNQFPSSLYYSSNLILHFETLLLYLSKRVLKIITSYSAVADLRGAPGAPPTNQNFFNFMRVFRKSIKYIRLAPPFEECAPPPTTCPGSAPAVALR